MINSGDDAFLPIVAKLRLLFEDSVTERPLYWSTDTTFPFGYSYRFDDGGDGLYALLVNETAPLILATNPSLDRISAGSLDPRNLHVPREDLCQALKSMSLKVNP